MSKKAYQVLAAQEFQPGGSPPTEIELLQVGDWQTPWHGHVVNTIDDFKEMVANFTNGAGRFQPDNKLPINREHYKEEAYGWIHGLEIRGNSLWGTGIEWTPVGRQKLADKEYSYLSSEWSPVWQDPLNEEELVDNVFTGACLTNYPLFSGLQPLAASHKQKKNLTAGNQSIMLYMKGSVMNLEDLLKKDAAELSDEEKKFIVDNKGDLTEDQVKTLTEAGVLKAESDPADDPADDPDPKDDPADDPQDDPADDPADPDNKSAKRIVSISASKLRTLEANAARGVEAAKKLEAKENSDAVAGITISASNKNGRFLEASKTKLTKFYSSLNATQKKDFSELINELPKVPLAQRASIPEKGVGVGAVAELESKVKAKMEASRKEGKPLSFMQATKKIKAEDKDLAARVKEEQQEN